MDRRMAAHCSSSSSLSSSRLTPSASGDNYEALLSDANNSIKKGKHEKERGDDGRRRSRDGKNESTVRRQPKEKEFKSKDYLSHGDKKSLTSKSGIPPGRAHGDDSEKCVGRETPSVKSSSRVTTHIIDPEWAAAMNARYGLDGEESPFSVVDEAKKETSPPRQPKRADETPPPTPLKPAPAVKPLSDPYDNEDEDPATAALRREIRECVKLLVSLAVSRVRLISPSK